MSLLIWCGTSLSSGEWEGEGENSLAGSVVKNMEGDGLLTQTTVFRPLLGVSGALSAVCALMTGQLENHLHPPNRSEGGVGLTGILSPMPSEGPIQGWQHPAMSKHLTS